MQFYRRTEKKKIWHRHPVCSFFTFLRDVLIFLIPINHFPEVVVKVLFGVVPQFVFFIHPRRVEDVYVAYPFLGSIRRWLGKSVFHKVLYLLPPLILGITKTAYGIDGIIVTSALLPEILLKDRKSALKNCIKCLRFSSKITKRKGVFGLGALWPMVTRRGLALKPYASTKDITVTSGHCGTLISLFLSIEKLAELGEIPFDKLKVVILGVGKMGAKLANILNGKVGSLTLVDVNEVKLNRVTDTLEGLHGSTSIQKYLNNNEVGHLKEILGQSHVGVCVTSNIRRILKPTQIPDNTIIIDDSRPEGVSRQVTQPNCLVLEGGLMKIKGIKQNYDFGFGIDENVFGCFAETFLLAVDKTDMFKPTLGDVDFGNFRNMMLACNKFGVSLGDFKCQDELIDLERMSSIIKNKG